MNLRTKIVEREKRSQVKWKSIHCLCCTHGSCFCVPWRSTGWNRCTMHKCSKIFFNGICSQISQAKFSKILTWTPFCEQRNILMPMRWKKWVNIVEWLSKIYGKWRHKCSSATKTIFFNFNRKSWKEKYIFTNNDAEQSEQSRLKSKITFFGLYVNIRFFVSHRFHFIFFAVVLHSLEVQKNKSVWS